MSCARAALFVCHELVACVNVSIYCLCMGMDEASVAGIPTGRSLACRPPIAAGMGARPGDNLRLPPAIRFHLQVSSGQMHAYTTRSQDSPNRGAVTRHKDTGSHAQSQATESWCERTTTQSRRIQYLTTVSYD